MECDTSQVWLREYVRCGYFSWSDVPLAEANRITMRGCQVSVERARELRAPVGSHIKVKQKI